MKIAASFFYAARFLFAKKKNGTSGAKKSLFGAMLCIGISLIPLVTVLVISNGMVEGITERMIGLSSSHLQVFFRHDMVSTLDELNEATAQIASAPAVVSVCPELQGIALAAGNEGRTGATIRAVRNDIFQVNDDFKTLFSVVDCVGEEPVLSDEKSVIIGARLATILHLKAGDSVRLISTKMLSSGKIVPRVQTFVVNAIVSSGYQELDALWVFVPLEAGFSLLDSNLMRLCVGVKTANAFSADLKKTAFELRKYVPAGSTIHSWDELNAAQYENFASTKLLLMVIMLLVVLVASVNISSALIMLVMERQREIAILKSLGGSSEGISAAFLIVGASCGAGGVLFGIPIGLLCAVNCNFLIKIVEKMLNTFSKFVYLLRGIDSYTDIKLLDPAYYLQNIPLVIPLPELLCIGCGTLVLSLLASAIPAIRAGQEKPINTLRKI